MFIKLYDNLSNYLDELFKRFIINHIEEISSTSQSSLKNIKKYKTKDAIEESDYRLDVQAYTVLSHAAFENYFEDVAIGLMKNAFSDWDSNKKISDILLTQICYLLSYNERQERFMSLEIKTKGNRTDLAKVTQYITHIDNLRQEAEKFFTKQIKDNHGIAIDYLLHVLIPVAIDINQDPDMMNSLKKLKESRGEMAHKRSLTKIPIPTEIYEDIQNCLNLCNDIKIQCNNKIQPLPSSNRAFKANSLKKYKKKRKYHV